jgi:hypothetical protein
MRINPIVLFILCIILVLVITVALVLNKRRKKQVLETGGIFDSIKSKGFDDLIDYLNNKSEIIAKSLDAQIKSLDLNAMVFNGSSGLDVSPSNHGWFDAWVDNPAGSAMGLLDPVLKAVGLSALQLQNVLPASGSCSGCVGKSPIAMFSNGLKVKDISGLEKMKIVSHDLDTSSNTTNIGIGLESDTDINVSFAGSIDVKHKCTDCSTAWTLGIKARSGEWREMANASNLSIKVKLKKGTLLKACASVDLYSKYPVYLHTLELDPSAKPDFEIASIKISKGNTITTGQAVFGILKAFGMNQAHFISLFESNKDFTNKVKGKLLCATKDEINEAISNEVASICKKSFSSLLPACRKTATTTKPALPKICGKDSC